jgi:hypothetical protein
VEGGDVRDPYFSSDHFGRWDGTLPSPAAPAAKPSSLIAVGVTLLTLGLIVGAVWCAGLSKNGVGSTGQTRLDEGSAQPPLALGAIALVLVPVVGIGVLLTRRKLHIAVGMSLILFAVFGLFFVLMIIGYEQPSD